MMLRTCLTILVLLSGTLGARHQKMNLQNAIRLNLVKAKAQSLGGYQGYCIQITLRNATADSLTVFIEPGRRLNSSDDKFQDILVVKEEQIFMARQQEKTAKIKGYCCQASNCSPSAGTKYELNTLADSTLVSLARYLNLCGLDPEVEQLAIWAISDKKSTAAITGKNDSLFRPLRQLVAGLKGEPLPWYTMITRTIVFAGGSMQTFPVQLKGKLKYSNEQDGYVTLFIVDEQGRPVCLLRNEWMKACSDNEYILEIPVGTLSKGKYAIGLKSETKELTRREFEI